MNKTKFYSGQQLIHKMLGEVFIDDACVYLNSINNDPTSCYVLHEGEIKEVTASLIKCK